MKVRFVSDFDYTPSLKPQVTYAYKASETPQTVKRECGEAAIAAGAAVLASLFDTSEDDAPAPSNLNDRVRVERRRELVDSTDEALWDDGGALEWDDDGGAELAFDGEEIGDGAGNFEGDWIGIGPAVLRCEIVELMRGGEQVIADKLRGVSLCTVEVRVSKFTRAITTDDRFRVPGTDRVLNIRQAPPPGRSNFIKFTCEAGVAT